MTNDPSEILTVEETAAYLKIPVSSVYKLAQQGKIPGQKVGRHWRFHRAALADWIAGSFSYDDKEESHPSLDFS